MFGARLVFGPALLSVLVSLFVSASALACSIHIPPTDCSVMVPAEDISVLPANYLDYLGVQWAWSSDTGVVPASPFPDDAGLSVWRRIDDSWLPQALELQQVPGSPDGHRRILLVDPSPGVYEWRSSAGTCSSTAWPFVILEANNWPVQTLPAPSASWWVDDNPNRPVNSDCEQLSPPFAAIDVQFELPEAWLPWKNVARESLVVNDVNYGDLWTTENSQEYLDSAELKKRVYFSCGGPNERGWPTAPEGAASVAFELSFFGEQPVRTPSTEVFIDCASPAVPLSSGTGCFCVGQTPHLPTVAALCLPFAMACAFRRRRGHAS